MTMQKKERLNHPLLLLALTLGGVYLARLWRDDVRAAAQGRPHANPLPGATPAPPRAVLIAVIGAVAIVALETAGEFALDVAAEQSRITWLFALYTIVGAPVIEELIFRGWIVVEHRGRRVMWAAAVGASLVFAVLHPFLWRWDEGGFEWTLGRKGWFSTTVVFATSLWFYAARLAKWNPTRSLLPCFAAHATKNVGVVAVKAATGFVSGLW